MKRFILTGPPGAGKTAVLRQLDREGFGVVEEAATDVIALEQANGVTEPWTNAAFIDRVVDLQRIRQIRAATAPDVVQFHDQRRVFFIHTMGFIRPTEARRISFEEAQRFERVHEKTYREHGFEIVPIGAGSVLDRAATIRLAL